MKTIHRNSRTFFPQPDQLAVSIQFLHYFKPKRSISIYQLTSKDFTAKEVTAVNIENDSDTITMTFNTPVTPLKAF